jgi:excisionase family DNA binding protein
MPALPFPNLESAKPSAKEIEIARKSSRILSNVSLKKARSIEIMLEGDKERRKSFTVPLSAFKLFVTILTEMGQGNAVTLIPMRTELTTQKAADLLNVSRPYLIQLLESKKIPFRKVGTRRKILFKDVMVYKAKTDEARRKVLDELTEEAQKFDLGY